MRIFLILTIINFIVYCAAADKDQAYQNYLQRCAQASDLVFEHLGITDLAKIVQDYTRISYDQWQKNGQDLIEAAQNGKLEKVKELLEEADVNTKDKFGCTALMEPAAVGHREIVELLINSGANVNAKDNGGNTALMWAAIMSHKEIVELLINSMADINSKNDVGETALKMVEWHKNQSQTKIINAQKYEDRQWLFAKAVIHQEMIELLKKAGAE